MGSGRRAELVREFGWRAGLRCLLMGRAESLRRYRGTSACAQVLSRPEHARPSGLAGNPGRGWLPDLCSGNSQSAAVILLLLQHELMEASGRGCFPSLLLALRQLWSVAALRDARHHRKQSEEAATQCYASHAHKSGQSRHSLQSQAGTGSPLL